MNTIEEMEAETQKTHGREAIQLPFGLLGFESVKNYILLTKADEAPFMWFQMLDDAKRAFLVVPPQFVVPDYEPNISDEDVEFLGLEDPADAFVLNIVTLRKDGRATVNLKGPIVVHRRTLIGKQVIPVNAAQYAIQHPLPTS